MKRYLSTFLLLFAALLFSQEPSLRFEHIKKSDGLPANTIDAFLEDSYGFMWFGTRDGLVRYNGRKFKIFKPNSVDSTAIANQYVRALAEDQSRRLWIATHGGLSCYDLDAGHFTNYYELPGFSSGGPVMEVNTLLVDSEGRLWLGLLRDGVKFIDTKTMTVGAFESYPP